MKTRLGPREIVAWVLVVALSIVAAVALAHRTEAPAGASNSEETSLLAENRRLRASIARLRNEELAFHAEMDRMLGRLRQRGAVAAARAQVPPPDGAAPPEKAATERATSLCADIASLSAGMLEGKPDNMRELFERISQLQAMGPEALPALRKSLAETTDPGARRILAGLLVQKGSPQDQELLLGVAAEEKDPDTKQLLLSSARLLGGAGESTAQEEMKSMAASSDPRSRASAIRGLPSTGDGETAGLLEHALAADESEAVRLAALDALLADPQRREAALQAALRDSSPRIRAIAECRQRLPDLESEVQAGP